MKENHSWLLLDHFHLSGKEEHMFTEMSPCVSSATPTDPPKKQQQLHIVFKSGATGHLHKHNITKQAIPCTGLSSMMYVVVRYLPHQSSDCFDIFINMSSIINHPGGSEADPPSLRCIGLQVDDKVIGHLATCLAFKLQHFFLKDLNSVYIQTLEWSRIQYT